MLGIERNSDEALFTRLYNMVDNPATDSIASWSQSGKSFIVWNPVEFARKKFRMVGFETNEYANDNFVRGQPQLMKNIPKLDMFITKEDAMEYNNILRKEKEELLAALRKQELQIKELKYHLQHVRVCKL
ncbi:hypothetical protein EUTSA_v10015013mg [Eutrema salsugineum]|uniref:HSF-type DNA-binding domain-containing protein n=1 Tax=Eutrema salsugineum TaxID=72664 RepID=V4KZ17_EUTSA|nr:hypothetical protein EUTSA_v10015013mg [Eutrema salsugineum]